VSSAAPTGRRASVARARELVRMDVARWIRPESIAEPHEVTPLATLRALSAHAGLRAVIWLRVGWLAKQLGVRGVPRYVQRRLFNTYGLEIAPSSVVGGGLYIAHPIGSVLHARRIGDNVTVISQVTFGTRNDARWPAIGDGVFLGAGARVLGGIRVGAGARVGANAVVVHDVADGETVVGIPARPVQR
jgi:serine O-acetyltransferase